MLVFPLEYKRVGCSFTSTQNTKRCVNLLPLDSDKNHTRIAAVLEQHICDLILKQKNPQERGLLRG